MVRQSETDDLFALLSVDVKQVVAAYLECALWSSTDDDGNPLDAAMSVDDFARDAVIQAIDECSRFLMRNLDDATAEHGLHYRVRNMNDCTVAQRFGHDFWLTRNRHGAGFWDRPEAWGEEPAKRLTDAAHAEGSCDAYVGDDGLVYLS